MNSTYGTCPGSLPIHRWDSMCTFTGTVVRANSDPFILEYAVQIFLLKIRKCGNKEVFGSKNLCGVIREAD